MNSFSILGFIAAFFTTAAFLPQVIKSYKTKETKSISFSLVLIQASGNALWLMYGLFIKDFVIIAANIITFSFVFFLLILKIKYK